MELGRYCQWKTGTIHRWDWLRLYFRLTFPLSLFTRLCHMLDNLTVIDMLTGQKDLEILSISSGNRFHSELHYLKLCWKVINMCCIQLDWWFSYRNNLSSYWRDMKADLIWILLKQKTDIKSLKWGLRRFWWLNANLEWVKGTYQTLEAV